MPVVVTIVALAVLGAGLITGGIYLLAGVGPALIASGAFAFGGAYVLARGLNG